MLYLIGLGLGGVKDITLKGLEIVHSCQHVILESYTSFLPGCDADTLGAFYEHEVTVADRQAVEGEGADPAFIGQAEDEDVAMLVVGDPFGATTHTDLVQRARKRGIKVGVVHNASIMNAIAVCGLQLYRFGETITMCFFTDTWKPDSFYDRLERNRSAGLHTLCLLDIRVKEPTEESLARGKRLEYEPPRYMSISQCVAQLLEVEDKRNGKAYDADTHCVAVARIGSDDEKIVFAPMSKLLDVDMGPPLHSLVICGDLHEMEEEALEFYKL